MHSEPLNNSGAFSFKPSVGGEIPRNEQGRREGLESEGFGGLKCH